MSKKDYYNLLSVTPEFTAKELKDAYHKLALKLHPDKNLTDSTNAEEKFKELSKAYATLSNPLKRMMYDLFQSTDETVVESFDSSECCKFEKSFESPKTKKNSKRKRSRSRKAFEEPLRAREY